MGRKLGGAAVPLFVGRWVPSNPTWLGPRPTFVPSGIVIHPVVWPQYTWAKDRGATVPPSGGHRQTQYVLGRGLPPYQVAS